MTVPHALRRGDLVSTRDAYWVVWNVTRKDSVDAFPVRAADHRRTAAVLLNSPADQLLARASKPMAIRVDQKRAVRRRSLEYIGRLSGVAQCALSQAIVRLAVGRHLEAKWDAERRHRERAGRERCAV